LISSVTRQSEIEIPLEKLFVTELQHDNLKGLLH